MKYKNYNDLMSRTLNQIAAVYSADQIDNRIDFLLLLIRIYFDVLELPDEDIQRKEALEEVLTPLFRAKELAPPPDWKERYLNNAK
ncbi:MAG: hypothetical protein ACI4C4_07110 [Lachnospiraceae bacterium]